jgi:hypothetical protein
MNVACTSRIKFAVNYNKYNFVVLLAFPNIWSYLTDGNSSLVNISAVLKFWLCKTTGKLHGLSILLHMSRWCVSLNLVNASEPWTAKKTGWRGLCWSYEDENDVMFRRDGKWSHQASILTDSCWGHCEEVRGMLHLVDSRTTLFIALSPETFIIWKIPYQVQRFIIYRQKDTFFSAVVTMEITAFITDLRSFHNWEVVSVHLAAIYNLQYYKYFD